MREGLGNNRISLWAGAMALLLPALGRGSDLRVDGYFSDGCVLQRGARVEVRGTSLPGARVEVDFRGEQAFGTTDPAGQWRVEIGPLGEGGPDPLEIRSGKSKIRINTVWVGDVWVCLGQSNMAYNMAPVLPWTEGVPDFESEIAVAGDEKISLLPMPRFVYHEEWDQIEGRWLRSEPASVRHFSAVAWYMAQRLREQEDVPVGMIVSAIGSTGIESWLPGGQAETGKLSGVSGGGKGFVREVREYCRLFNAAFLDGSMPPNQGPSLFDNYLFTPSGCYNALVAPLTRYPVAGWVWYQGEGNARRAEAYQRRLEALIGDYRRLWKQPASPFIVVQLPGWKPLDDDTGTTWANLREAQRRTVLGSKAAALVVTVDVGDEQRIHPREKYPVGQRCAEAAAILKSGPDSCYGLIPEAAELKGNGQVEVRFRGDLPVSSIVCRGNFSPEMVYADGSRSTARGVKFTEHSLHMLCPDRKDPPVAIEYGFTNNPLPSLFLPDGTPVTPFRLMLTPPSPD